MSYATPLLLTSEAIRVLGVLLEKEKTTPDTYPLTLNGLISGCNQSTNRVPVVAYDEMTIERALTELRDKSLALRGVYAGSRVPKHRHNVEEKWGISPGAQAVLCVLFLRGPQTLGEIKQRTERLYSFTSLDECDKAIDELCTMEPPLAVRLAREPGQKEARIAHNIAHENSHVAEVSDASDRPSLQLIDGEKPDEMADDSSFFEGDPDIEERVEYLEKEVTVLTHEIMSLRAEIDELKDPSA
jgi:uncharacterized protein YceH (UPF0502 family)